MKTSIASGLLSTAITAFLFAAATASAATPAAIDIHEGFAYADITAMQAGGWTKQAKSQVSPVFVDVGTDRAVGFNNTQLKKSFSPASIAADSFTLTADLAMSQFMGGMYVLVASAPDAEGKVYGYAISWNGGSSGGTYSPNGSFTIGTVNGVTEANLSFGYSISGSNVNMSTAVRSNITITDRTGITPASIANLRPTAVSDFGSVTLTWEKSTGLLNLFLGSDTSGTPAISITNTAYSSFANIYVSGNGYSYVNNINLTVSPSSIPEPGTYALFVGAVIGSLVLFRRLRRSRGHRG
ncbi:PEP-CTERM sorting domain-containing protein [Opitutaceae bacterium TAV4]|uniref:PEP-CTERM sorting domain-containing protein n=1 Tax=Geminisphaera colitermitum TaxID=1148786 RepID=UPI000158C99F|nr:PEP-CTERM sorting domain-containing protein [Geminisphaera colitermitum]RRJ95507.1 PEP-CTERM sorting domain-containing protein [Opitutaceae bacterium TAV4]RRJ99678.1 PEP-CTERM sorting domain-containing protein [Opitutaceae bacterium TAV3]